MSWLDRLLGRPAFARPCPDRPLCVIGDIHGRLDLLLHLFDRIQREAPDATLVTVGDYVDRGPESRGVLEQLRAREGLVALRGNHEAMMLGFLDRPALEGPRWLGNGGDATLRSFGLPVPDDEAGLAAASRALRAELGGLEGWLRGLPASWLSGDVLVTHAGADPDRGPADQDEPVLTWGHPRFPHVPRNDGIWVAYGHRIARRPSARGGRIAVDTGAFMTGRLTAALIRPGEPVRFIAAEANRGG